MRSLEQTIESRGNAIKFKMRFTPNGFLLALTNLT